MGLINKLKSVLGLDTSSRGGEGGTAVTVEREREAESGSAPDTATERAVKEDGPRTESPMDETAVREESEPEPGAETPDPEPEATGGAAVEGADRSVDALNGIGPAYAERLGQAGVETVGDLVAADPTSLADDTGISQSRIESWIDQARGD